MRRSFSVFLLLSGLASAAIAQFKFNQKDWWLVCDNTRTCRAVGYEAGQLSIPVVIITRQAGANQQPTIDYLYGGLCDSKEVLCPKNASMRINGKTIGAIPLAVKNGDGRLSDVQTSELLSALISERSAKIQFVTPKPLYAREIDFSGSLSLNGARAVLLKMDQFQKRESTIGALVKKGDLSEEDVLQVLPIPEIQAVKPVATRVVDAKLGKQILASLKKPAKRECDELTSPLLKEEDGSTETTIYRLTNSKVLLSLRCWSGTKNQGWGYWIANDKPPYNPILVTTDGDPDEVKSFSGLISSRNMGHGSTGNVYSDSWIWDGQGFVRTESKETIRFRNELPWLIPSVVSKVLPPEKTQSGK
jgi:hypothetical protein